MEPGGVHRGTKMHVLWRIMEHLQHLGTTMHVQWMIHGLPSVHGHNKIPEAGKVYGGVQLDLGISNGSSGGSAISPGGFRFNICDEPKRCMEDPIDGISLWFRATWNRVRVKGLECSCSMEDPINGIALFQSFIAAWNRRTSEA
eukprot:1153419-Pelagomonas_calceolata.AAC.7